LPGKLDRFKKIEEKKKSEASLGRRKSGLQRQSRAVDQNEERKTRSSEPKNVKKKNPMRKNRAIAKSTGSERFAKQPSNRSARKVNSRLIKGKRRMNIHSKEIPFCD